MVGALVDNLALLFIEASVEDGKLFEQRYEQFDKQRHIGQAYSTLLSNGFQRLAQCYQRAAVDLVKGGRMRNGAPGALPMFRDTHKQPGQGLTPNLRAQPI